jgi:predicted ATPase
VITRLEISGFKSFHNFTIDLRPFQVFIGPNGVGKTNLFEAIVLLGNLANRASVEEALGQSRGDLLELFTTPVKGNPVEKMTFAVEMLIGQTVTGPTGRSLKPAANRLRYELTLERRAENGRQQVFVQREELSPIADSADAFVKDHIPAKVRKNWVVREKRPPYIATEDVKEQRSIHLNQDAPGGGRQTFAVGQLQHTALSVIDPANALRFPTAYAVKAEMANWRFLKLMPDLMRSKSARPPTTQLQTDGANLAAAVDYIAKQDAANMERILKDIQSFVPDVKAITTRHLAERDEYTLEVEMQDGSHFSSGVLSDGTLKLLALVTLKHDSRHEGVLCFEEPENGVQPQRLKQIVDVLYGLTTNFTAHSPERPLRQVLVNTHSPGVLASVPSESMFYVGMKLQDSGRETHVLPVKPMLFSDEDEKFYTWEQVDQFLATDSLARKRDELGL